jgi:hypothetical protein
MENANVFRNEVQRTRSCFGVWYGKELKSCSLLRPRHIVPMESKKQILDVHGEIVWRASTL